MAPVFAHSVPNWAIDDGLSGCERFYHVMLCDSAAPRSKRPANHTFLWKDDGQAFQKGSQTALVYAALARFVMLTTHSTKGIDQGQTKHKAC